MGGLIKVHTKSPFTYQGTDIRMGAATYNDYNVSLTHYHRISDQFAFSTGGFYEHTGGFYQNSTRNNERVDKGNAGGGRFRGIYLPKDNLKLDLNVSYEYSDGFDLSTISSEIVFSFCFWVRLNMFFSVKSWSRNIRSFRC